jgi:hypothetical protein
VHEPITLARDQGAPSRARARAYWSENPIGVARVLAASHESAPGTDLPSLAVQKFSQLLEVFETRSGAAHTVLSKVDGRLVQNRLKLEADEQGPNPPLPSFALQGCSPAHCASELAIAFAVRLLCIDRRADRRLRAF